MLLFFINNIFNILSRPYVKDHNKNSNGLHLQSKAIKNKKFKQVLKGTLFTVHCIEVTVSKEHDALKCKTMLIVNDVSIYIEKEQNYVVVADISTIY